ncbi:type IV secretory system conjugative DNA transfer family protein [uncultured Helicobacter sp.]|uniref:type IV secretory system conjugative DNA transfer family protein n=1 Tax=uncultured Helicobacter sp. TaxID=175537 RepID=UPI002631769E|nr:type IV secretory system conjugative DNA transfer family protein [uncultured Helicobacter sp.]
MGKKITLKQWLLGLFVCIVLGIIFFFASVKYIFNPNFADIFHTGFLLLQNLTSGKLKFKAYLTILFALMPLGVLIVYFFIHSSKGLEDYGNASFAKKEDFAKMGINNEQGLMLGCLHKKNGEIEQFLRCVSPLSCLIVAPPGTGKTASIALPNLFTLVCSVVVLDIKGELFYLSAGYRQQKFGHRILRFSPLYPSENTMFFNPFDKKVIVDMDYVKMKQLADQIAGTIFVGEKGKENDHWIVSAKTLFTFFATYFMQKNKHTSLGEIAQAPKKDFYEVIPDDIKLQFGLATQDEFTQKLKRDLSKDSSKAFFKAVANDESLHDITRNQANAYTIVADNEFASVKSTFDTFMAVFQNPNVDNATSKMSFDYYDLRKEKISCYIVIQTEDIDILAPLIRIFVETMFKKLMSGEGNSDPNKFIYFIGDEFVRFGKMPFLLEAPALCRSYGLIPIYITQSYEQIKKYYGEDDLNILRSNVGYQVVFTMNSAKDAEELSKMIGKFTRKKISRSQGNLDLIKSSDSTSSEGYELVPAQDILNMPNTDILILVRGFVKHPIKAKVNYWFKNPQWSGADKIPLKSNEEIEKEKNEQELQKTEAEKEQIETESESARKSYMQVVNENPFPTKENNESQRVNPYVQIVIDKNELKAQQILASRKRQEAIRQELQEEQKVLDTIQPFTEKEKQEIIRQTQEINTENPQTEEKLENTETEQTSKDKIAYIEKALGENGYKTFLLHLASPDDLDTTPTEIKLEQMRNLMAENKIPINTIKDIIQEIKNKEAEEP